MLKKVLIWSVFWMCCINTMAQGTSGKDFWVAFLDGDFYCESRTPPPPTKPGPWDEDTLELYITSKYAATVIVGVNPLSMTDFADTFQLVPYQIHHVQLPSNIACRDFFSDAVSEFSVHITSDSNINVQAVNRFWSSKGSTTVIPTESIPQAPEYFVTTNASPNQWGCWVPYGQKPIKSAEFVIVGISDFSVIEVIPTGFSTIYNNKRGIPYEVKLRKGQTFSYNTIDDDLTGSIIRSRDTSSKFAVFAGNRLTYSNTSDSNTIPCVSGSSYNVFQYMVGLDLADLDHTYEQMVPTVSLGLSYTALPFKNSMGGYYLKVVSIEKNTRLSVDGKFFRIMEQGEYFVLNVGRDSARRISADKRISVTQFAKGTKCNKHTLPKNTMGDVSQIQLVPDEQMATEANISRVTHTWSAWANSNADYKPENYLNVMVKTGDTAQFRLNSKPVPNALWKKIPVQPGYRLAQIDLDTINYKLASPKGFLAYVYGNSAFEGYAYAAAANFKPLRMDFVFNSQCVFDTIKFTALKSDSFLNFSWKFGDKSGVISGHTINRIFKDTGWQLVTLFGRQVRTNLPDSVMKWIYINRADQTPVLSNDTMICGKVDFTVYSKKFDPLKKYKWNDGSESYYYNFKNGGLFWEMVTERTGCVFIDTIRIENHPFPKAKFTSSDSVFCSNGTKDITFINQSTSSDSVLFYNWDFGDLNVNDTHRIMKHKYKKPDLYQVLLRVRTIYGCDDIASQLVEILPTPLVDFTITNADTCFKSNTITLKNNTVKDTANFLKFKWNFGEGTTISNRNPLQPRVYPDTGKYTVSLMYEYTNGCSDTMKRSFRIYSDPEADFTYSRGGSCLNDTIRFLNGSTSKHLPLKYDWNYGDNITDSINNPSHRYAKSGLFDVALIARSPQGCRDTANAAIRVFGSPKVSFSINDSLQCLTGNNFIFVNNSTTDTGIITSRNWRYDDGSKVTDKDTLFRTFATDGQHSLLLTVSNNFGCKDSLLKKVFVKKGPQVSFTVNKGSQCFNDQDFDFMYKPVVGSDSISSMNWYYGADSLLNSGSLDNVTFPNDGSWSVQLKVTSLFGCPGIATMNVHVNPQPLAKFNIPNILQCLQGNSFNMVNQSTLSKGTMKLHQWDFGDQTNSSLFTPAPKTYATVGKYKVAYKVESDSGCTDTASAWIELHPSAILSLDPVAEVCLNDTIDISGNALVPGGSIKEYTWDFGDKTATVSTTSGKVKHIYGQAGVFPVLLTTTTDHNCKESKLFNNAVVVNELPNAAFSYDIKDGGPQNSSVLFTDLTSPTAISRFWDFGTYGNSNRADTTIHFTDTGFIKARLYVTNNKGCKDSIEKLIFIAPGGEMYFPNAFTANGDGLNDGFGPQGILYATNYKFMVFNRWGEIMFKSEKLGETWDGTYQGKTCPNGVYIYTMVLNDFYGKYKSYAGSVLLLW